MVMRTPKLPVTPPPSKDPSKDDLNYDINHYLSAVAQADGFVTYLSAKLDAVQALTPQWPPYVWEEVSPYLPSPRDPLLEAILDLSTKIGNINLRLEALHRELDGPVIS